MYIVPALAKTFKNILEEKMLKVTGIFILMFFFLVLLINFILLSELNTSNSILAKQLGRNARSSKDIQTANDQIKKKEKILTDLGWDQGVNKSILIDQAAALLPAGVTWTKISLNPTNTELTRINKEISFSSRQLLISGNSAAIVAVNEWIAKLKTKIWVKNIQLISYDFNDEQNNGEFVITINY